MSEGAAAEMLPADAAAELSRRVTALEGGEGATPAESSGHLWVVAIVASTIATVVVALAQWAWTKWRARAAALRGGTP